MSPHDPQRQADEQEQQLRALFDATAEPPSQDQLNRLARSAAQIPERAEAPSPVRLWLRRLAPALGLAAAAAAAWFLLVGRGDGSGDGTSPLPPTPSVAMTDEPDLPDGPGTPEDGSDESPLLLEEQEEMALAVLDGETEVDPDDELGGDLDNPLAALDMGTAAIEGPLDGLDVLFPPEEDEESYDLYGDALADLLEEDG